MRYALATLFILFLLIVGVVIIAGRDDNSSDGGPIAKNVSINDYAGKSNAVVSWTQQGEIVGNDEYRSVRVTVSPSQRLFEVLAGYNNEVIESKTFANNSKAFEVFMNALNAQGFGRERSRKQPTENGACPLGNRYVYTLAEGSTLVMRTWSASCTRAEGNFGGDAPDVRSLFKNQITDYDDLVSGVDL